MPVNTNSYFISHYFDLLINLLSKQRTSLHGDPILREIVTTSVEVGLRAPLDPDDNK